MENYPKLSVVIPCFNESDNVTTVIHELQNIVKNYPYPMEVIVVDGNSSDGTPDRLTEVFADLDSDIFKLVLLTQRGGYGADIMHGLAQATGDVLSWTHADLQTDIIDIIKAYELYLQKNTDNDKVFIKGIRKNRRLLEKLFSMGMEIVTYFVLNTYLSDINAQPKMFSREFYQTYLLNNPPNDFSLDLFAMYNAKINGYTIYELPVIFKPRIHGEAKGGGGGWKMRINLIKRTFKYIIKTRQNLINKQNK